MKHTKILFRGEYTYSDNNLTQEEKDLMKRDYYTLRELAVAFINPLLEKWNAEFGTIERKENDPYYEYGGSEYCEFIRSKEREILDAVNRVHPSSIIKIDADEIGDLVAIHKEKGTVMHLTLIPLHKLEGA